MPSTLTAFASVTHHVVIHVFRTRAEDIFKDSSHDTKLAHQVLGLSDTIAHVNILFKLLINNFVPFDPDVELLIVDIV